MRKLYSILIAMAAVCLVHSCSEEQIMTFDGKVEGIYLQKNASYTMDSYGNPTSYTYTDSTMFSFSSYVDTLKSIRISLPVKILGYVTDYDRPFVLKVAANGTTAERGVHFDYDEASCVVPAGKATVNVPITLYRHADLLKKTLRVEFELESNQYFTVELAQYKNSSNWRVQGDTLDGHHFRIIFSELYSEPSWWDFSGAKDKMGAWSVKKEMKVNSLMGWTHRDWLNWVPMAGRMTFAAKLLRKTLQEAADAGEPIREEDGSFMQLLPPYEVDYSAYE